MADVLIMRVLWFLNKGIKKLSFFLDFLAS